MSKIIYRTILIALVIVILLLVILVFKYDIATSSGASSLTSVNPDRAPTKSVVSVSGLSYRDDSEIIFYKGYLEQLRVIAIPQPVFSANTSPLKPTSTGFKFTVPQLPPDLYNIRLSHPDLGVSKPVYFTIIPLVEKIVSKTGNHLTNFVINGRDFNYSGQTNIIRLFPISQTIPVKVIRPRIVVNIPTNSNGPGLQYILDFVPSTNLVNNTILDTYVPINGSGFAPSSKGIAFLDVNQNGILDREEFSQDVITSDTGSFSTAMLISSESIINSILQFNLSSNMKFPVGTYHPEVFAMAGENIFESSYKSDMDRTLIIVPHVNAITPAAQSINSNIMIAGIYFHSEITKINIGFFQDSKKLAEVKPADIGLGGTVISAKVPDLVPGEYLIKVSVEDFAISGHYIESDNQLTIRIIEKEE